MMGPWNGYGFGWGAMWFGMLIPVLILGLLIWGIVRVAAASGGATASRTTALEILEQRLARGEITAEEFAATRRQLLGR